MPKHLVVSQAVEASLVFFLNLRPGRVIIHYNNPSASAVDVAMANTIYTSLANLWTAQLAPLCPTTVSFVRVDLRDLNQEGMGLVASTAAAHNGTAAAADLLPVQIAACLTVRTEKAGKKFRGRMYWGGFAETANGTDNHMTTAAKTALDAFSNGFVAAANVAGLTFGVLHRPTAFDEITGLPIAPGLGFVTPATSVLCRDNVWDNQRRRAG